MTAFAFNRYCIPTNCSLHGERCSVGTVSVCLLRAIIAEAHSGDEVV